MADPTEKKTDPAFAPADSLESYLAGFLVFVGQFLATLRDLAFRPTHFSQVIRAQPDATPYAKPVTFITLISFLAIRIFRFGIMVFILGFGVTSCRAETWTEPEYPSLLDELVIPSFSEFLWYGIPTLILVLLLSLFLKWVLLKRRSESGALMATTIYYLVGFQFIAYLVLFAILSVIQALETEPERSYLPYVVDTLILIFLLWILATYVRVISQTIPEDQLRVRRRVLRQLWITLWMLILMAVTTYTGGKMAFALAEEELAERRSRPVLLVNLIGFEPPGEDRITANLLVRNNSGEQVQLISSGITIYGDLVHQGQVTNSCLGAAPVIVIAPEEVCWLTVSFDRAGPAYISENSVVLENIIQFHSVEPDAPDGTISAYIRKGEETFEISGIE